MEQRLQQFHLRPLEVGGEGDCFFRAVSHQLYGDPTHHLEIRAAGIAYTSDNPDRFIESNTEYSWLQYLNNMSIQGTWCDNMIIQAVADQYHLKIFIIETEEGFDPFTIIQAVSSPAMTDIYLGHLGEYHYVSTTCCLSSTNILQSKQNCVQSFQNIENSINRDNTVNISSSGEKRLSSDYGTPTKQMYQAQYMRNKRSTQDIQTRQENNRRSRECMKRKRSTEDLEAKCRRKEYMKNYRKKKQAGPKIYHWKV